MSKELVLSHLTSAELRYKGPILKGSNGGDCLNAPGHCLGALEMPQYKIMYNFFIGWPLPRRKCLGVLALSKNKRGIQAWTFLGGHFRTIASRAKF